MTNLNGQTLTITHCTNYTANVSGVPQASSLLRYIIGKYIDDSDLGEIEINILRSNLICYPTLMEQEVLLGGGLGKGLESTYILTITKWG